MSETIDKPYWRVSRLLDAGVWTQAIFEEIDPYVVERIGEAYGRVFKTPRLSVVITDCDQSAVIVNRQCVTREIKDQKYPDPKSSLFSYGALPSISWDLVPNIRAIKQHLEDHVPGLKIDFCLAHLYQDGSNNIGWHADREAIDPPRSIYSLSLGATRKFRFRKKGETKGWEAEYDLADGIMVWMKPGCQTHYKHCVPKQMRVTDWRINLTFRIA
jgi:2-oxoglutarate-Fe(II)-dependent oxygenase superfamily protein